jgi:hypothetical protein
MEWNSSRNAMINNLSQGDWHRCSKWDTMSQLLARRLAAIQGMDPKFTTMIKNRPQDNCINLKSAAPKLNWR